MQAGRPFWRSAIIRNFEIVLGSNALVASQSREASSSSLPTGLLIVTLLLVKFRRIPLSADCSSPDARPSRSKALVVAFRAATAAVKFLSALASLKISCAAAITFSTREISWLACSDRSAGNMPIRLTRFERFSAFSMLLHARLFC